MKQNINEVKRMQQLAGLIKENEMMGDDIDMEYDSTPDEAPYQGVLNSIQSWESADSEFEQKLMSDFMSTFSKGQSISKQDYESFVNKYAGAGDEADMKYNWISIFK
jgi:hypothetical protein